MLVKLSGVNFLDMSKNVAEHSDFINSGKNFIEKTNSFVNFINDVNNEGIWMALYDKPFSQVVGDFLSDLFRDVMYGLLSSGDLFFLLPAVAFMFITFIMGRNRFTKWIIPLWFTYFITSFFKHFYM